MREPGGGRVKAVASASKRLEKRGPVFAPTADLVPDRFELCLPFTLKEEGGFVDNPQDPGGATFMGITLTTYRAWMADNTLTIDDLKAISTLRLAAIYETEYWDAVSAAKLPLGVDLSVFDMGVNAGPMRSIKLLQASVDTVQDGIIGPVTLAAVQAFDLSYLCMGLYTKQAEYYRSLSNFPTFGTGWLHRCAARWHAAMASLPSAHAVPAE